MDDPEMLRPIVSSLHSVGRELPIIFPVHPRTRQRISDFGMATDGLQLCSPVSYLEFLALEARAKVVITDSGGIQEETTFLGIPCLTLRSNTERPVTVEIGTNTLIGGDMDKFRAELANILAGRAKKGAIPPLWDGHAAERIAHTLRNELPAG